jgi:acetolactate synthase small subunit
MSENQFQEMREILQVAVSLAQQSREDITALTQATRANTAQISRLSEKLDQFIQQAEADRQLISSEVRGIRIEVQRLVAHLFGEPENE